MECNYAERRYIKSTVSGKKFAHVDDIHTVKEDIKVSRLDLVNSHHRAVWCRRVW
jgi:hypothetical protein